MMRLHFLFFAIALCFAGCGGDDDSSGDAGPGGTVDSGGGGTDGGGGGTDGGNTGTDAGEPPVDTCGAGEACVACVVGVPPSTEDECTCLACPVFPASMSGCTARQMQYATVCADWMRRTPCPDVLCTEPPTVVCTAGECVLE